MPSDYDRERERERRTIVRKESAVLAENWRNLPPRSETDTVSRGTNYVRCLVCQMVLTFGEREAPRGKRRGKRDTRVIDAAGRGRRARLVQATILSSANGAPESRSFAIVTRRRRQLSPSCCPGRRWPDVDHGHVLSIAAGRATLYSAIRLGFGG